MNGKKIKALLLSSLLDFLLLIGASSGFAADFPHNKNSQEQIACTHCHDASQGSTWWTDQANNNGVCGQCHNSAAHPGQDVVTHKSEDDTVLVQCTLCHNPHNQMQNRTWGAASYLYSGVSTSITSESLIQSGATWTHNYWQNMLVIPNVKYPKFIYKILSNTNDTITIDTVGGPPDNTINTNYCKSGSTFAIVWGKLIKENINGMNVKFFRQEGRNSFADNDVTIDGVCQVCHTQTQYFNKNGTIGHPGGVSGKKCTPCHEHKVGFKPTCTGCHGYPPLTSVPTGSDGLVNNEGGTGSASPGAHSKHSVTLAYVCDTCHTGGMPGVMPPSPYYDKKIHIGFNIANGAYQSGTYNGRPAPLSSEYTYTAGNAGTTVTQNGPTPMQCSNIYCHGSTIASGGTDRTPTWNVPSTGACGTCHGVSSSNYPDRASHAKHTGPKSGNVGYEIGCPTCHKTTTTDGNTTDQIKHVNNAADWGFDTSDSRVSSAQYRSASSGSVSNPPSGLYGTCSTVYCHGGTLQSGGTNTTPTWGNSSTAACGSCHGIFSSSNYPTRGSHTRHTGPIAGFVGVGMNCDLS